MPHESSDASGTPKVKKEPGSSSSRVKKHVRQDSRSRPAPKRPKKEEEEASSDEEQSAPHVKKAESDDEDSNIVHPSRKRVKGINGQPRPSTIQDSSEEEEEEEEEENKEHIAKVEKIFVRDPKDGYLPGSIVRIRCKNFLTYDFVEFSPGPRMNMILGPNGTGKSTIACAICIGLGFSINTLGRADQLSSFVKHGYDQGYIEIELKGEIGKKNLIVRRSIISKSNTSTWLINGKHSPKSAVEKEVANLDVQVGNLCSFLPQDRVNEFAKLKPEELLVETQKVAGHKNLNNWHNQLIDLGKKLKEAKEELETDQRSCTHEEERNKVLERDVKAFRKRKELEEQLSLYDIVVPYFRDKAKKKQMKELRLRWKEAGVMLRTAMEEHQPAIEFKKKMEQDLSAAELFVKDTIAMVNGTKKDVDRLKTKDRALADGCHDIQENIVALKRDEEESQNKIKDLEKKIKGRESQLEEMERTAVSQEAQTALTEQKEESTRTLRRIQQEKESLRMTMDDIDQQITRAEADEKKAKDELSRLANPKSRRLDNMRNPTDPKHRAIADGNFVDAFLWLRENRREFHNFIEPACFSVFVPNTRYAASVEACINPTQMRTFIFDNEEDYQRFNRYLDEKRFDPRPTTWFRPGTLQDLSPDFTPQQLAAAGMEGFVLDFVEAPDEVKFYLGKALDMHRIGVATDVSRANAQAATQLFSPNAPGVTGRYIIGSTNYAINRSAYGRRLPQTNTSSINAPVWFTDQPVNRDKKRDLEMRIEEASTHARAKKVEKEELDKREDDIRTRERSVKSELVHIEKEYKIAVERTKNLKRLRQTLEQDKLSLTAEKNRPSIERRANTLRQNLVVKANQRIRNVPKYEQVIGALKEQTLAYTQASFNVLQLTVDVASMERLIQSYTARHDQLKKEVLELEAEIKTLKEELGKTKAELEEKTAELTDEMREKLQTLVGELGESPNPDTVENQRLDIKSRLDMTGRVNHQVIKTYEDRQKKIEHLRSSIKAREAFKQKTETQVANVKGKWLPELKGLIERVNGRFSTAFDRIHCAGEVRLAEHEDYDKWSIEILVKFRSNEPLQLLTGQRQSGGERSLTTILYLMSLTGLAKTPFALVDEINQGMDVKYERAVHNELIQVTCAEDSGQYFLITPKLLPNLTYHENVTTLVINNGPWLDDSNEDTKNDNSGKASGYGDLGYCLEQYRRARSA
ncbi:P-loop containing nucleoside triphosphate hydrolase protein [Serendipita vermifera]|nr:P-loop containing nucleoside triphosphate hydrolase protein [Serendipita vermifera]